MRKKAGFSIAEAMVTLTVVSVAMAASAPIITKATKNSNNSVDIDVILRQLEPPGMVKFFHDRGCPTGWEPLTADDGSSLEGYYIRLTTNGNNAGTTLEPSLPNIIAGFPGVGQWNAQGDNAKPGKFYELDTDKNGLYGAMRRVNTEYSPVYGVRVDNTEAERDDYFEFNASLHNEVYGRAEKTDKTNTDEVRPRSVNIVACKKSN